MTYRADSPTGLWPPRECPEEGFTLIELLTTLAVMVVLLLLGAVSFDSAFKSNRLYSAQNELITSLALARSESVLRGVPVVLMSNASVADNEFGAGWTVFADVNGNNAFDAGEPVLRRQEALPTDIVAKTGDVSSITFASSGFLVPASAITLRICRSVTTGNAVDEYQLTVQPNGMTDVSTVPCP